MGTKDNKPERDTTTSDKLTKEQRLAQAQAYAQQFTFGTLSEEELKKMRRNVYAYLL